MGEVILYSYFRSSAAYRVRAALNLKGITFRQQSVDLLKNDNFKDDYVVLNPYRKVPTLVIDGHTLCQSVAILEYLEETRPKVPLLPKDPILRHKVREIVNAVSNDIAPIQNLRILNRFKNSLISASVSESDAEVEKAKWAKLCIEEGFEGLEAILSKTMGTYSVGDKITMADIVLLPQIYNAHRWGANVEKYPHIATLEIRLLEVDAIKMSRPENQPDAPKSP